MNIEGKNPSDFLKMMHHFSGKRLYGQFLIDMESFKHPPHSDTFFCVSLEMPKGSLRAPKSDFWHFFVDALIYRF